MSIVVIEPPLMCNLVREYRKENRRHLDMSKLTMRVYDQNVLELPIFLILCRVCAHQIGKHIE
jgi:hypothetical protein